MGGKQEFRSRTVRAHRIEAILNWVTGPRILDVGCAGHFPEIGSPYWLHGELRRCFPDVIGIDISDENISYLTATGLDNIFVMNAESFYFPEPFDTIVAGELIEHLSNPGKFLQRCREHLKPGGRLILTTPYPFALFNILYSILKFPRTCSNTEHTCWFCPQTLMELARRHGFRVIHWELVPDYRPDVKSRRYRAFLFLLPLIPLRRLRCNTLLMVLTPA